MSITTRRCKRVSQSCLVSQAAWTFLVNNAGRAMLGACEETSAEEARDLFDTNVFSIMRMVSAVLPSMRARNSGRIINVSSLSGFVGVPFHGVYAASKHALAGYSEALRMEVEHFGIWVSLVEPAAHRTGIRMTEPRDALPLHDHGRKRAKRPFARRSKAVTIRYGSPT
jgi:short-subunit dehydrogenase